MIIPRRGLITGGAALAAYSKLAQAQLNQVPVFTVPGSSSTYIGPGDFASAAAAFMLRGYSAATQTVALCINLRRSSDNVQQDFGLANGNLDQDSIGTFGGVNATGTGALTGTTLTFTGGVIGGQVTGGTVAAGTVIVSGASPTWQVNISQTVASATLSVANALFVTKLYDQTGGGNDAVQVTAANQPYLILNAENNRPGIYFGASSSLYLQAVSIANIWATGAWSVAKIFLNTVPGSNGGGVHDSTSSLRPWVAINSTSLPLVEQIATSVTGVWTSTSAVSLATGYVLDVAYSQSALSNVPVMTLNGNALVSSNTQPVGTITNSTGLLLGNRATLSRGFPGTISEWLFFEPVPSSVNQEAIRQNSGAYYGILVA